MKAVWILGVAALMSFSGISLSTNFPVPPHTKQSLFYIHRNLNNHSVVYEVNLTEKGFIDPEVNSSHHISQVFNVLGIV